jgi:hypothetical protein
LLPSIHGQVPPLKNGGCMEARMFNDFGNAEAAGGVTSSLAQVESPLEQMVVCRAYAWIRIARKAQQPCYGPAQPTVFWQPTILGLNAANLA